MSPTRKAILPLPNTFTRNAKIAYSFNNLKSGSLISIGQLCDDDCIAIFTKYIVKIIKKNKILIKGRRTQNGLWKLPIGTETPTDTERNVPPSNTAKNVANGVIQLDSTKSDLAQYYGATLFSPVKSTLLRAIHRHHFTSWPAMTTKLMRKHLPKIIPTTQGHLDQEPKNIRSTKDIDDDIAPRQETNNVKTNDIMCIALSTNEICKSYSDQTGQFPITSSRGHKYIFVFYHYDTNFIMGIPIKSRNAPELCEAWHTAFAIFKAHGETPNIHILDNECSKQMKTMFDNENVTYQLVPPHIHRRNAAERAIRTYKNHLIAGLYTCDPNFPFREWDRLLPQCDITINLLRSARRNPSLSAYAALLGNFDLNRTPMAPPGTKVIIHEKSNNRKSWAGHGTEAWYIGPSLEHYRCFKCYVPATFSERNADTVQFPLQKLPFLKFQLTTISDKQQRTCLPFYRNLRKVFLRSSMAPRSRMHTFNLHKFCNELPKYLPTHENQGWYLHPNRSNLSHNHLLHVNQGWYRQQ